MSPRSCRGSRRRRCGSAALLAITAFCLFALPASGHEAATEPLDVGTGHHHMHAEQSLYSYYAPADFGCARCRNADDCSIAVHNQSSGVFCGDVLSTLQPCCCTFRNECITTIFSDSCDCLDSAQEAQLLNTRFYLFVVLTVVAWVLLIYDKMCAGPYKVMNSNHQALAHTPTAADAVNRAVPSAADGEDITLELPVDGEVDELSPRHRASPTADTQQSTSHQPPTTETIDRVEVEIETSSHSTEEDAARRQRSRSAEETIQSV